MKRSPRPRNAVSLSHSVDRQLTMYAIAAGAAGVGALALAQPAAAKIVYTPAHVVIGHGGVNSFHIDLDHDGVPDLALASVSNACTDAICYANLNAYPLGNLIEGKRVRSHSFYQSFASAVRAGNKVGPHAPFIPGSDIGCVMLGIVSNPSSHYRKVVGDWNNVKDRYLGVKFSVHNKTHFGWVRLTVRDNGHYVTGVLTGYAYETIPNKAIIAGKTKGPDEIDDTTVAQPNPAALAAPAPTLATLGALAIGAPGLSIWRREESAHAAQ
jgi:hypothetical protein